MRSEAMPPDRVYAHRDLQRPEPEAAARSTSATPVRSRVERLVIEALPKGAPEAERVARALGLVSVPLGAS